MTTDLDTARPAPDGAALRSPLASRAAVPRWLNARVVVGLLLVLVSVVAVARIVAGTDRTVPVLVAADDLTVGQSFTPDLVEERGVLFDDGLDRYLTGPPGAGYVVVRPVEAGELVPRSAVRPADELADVRYVTLTVPAAEAPAAIGAGAVVDVWLVPDDATVTLLLSEVAVTATSSGTGGLSESGRDVRVTLALTAGDVDEATATLVHSARTGQVYLTMRPAAP